MDLTAPLDNVAAAPLNDTAVLLDDDTGATVAVGLVVGCTFSILAGRG